MTQTASLAAFIDPLMLAFVCGLSLVVAWMQNGSATLVSAFRVLAGDLWRNQDKLADQAHRGFLITEHLVAERGISCADRTRSDSAFMRMAADLLANNRNAEQFHQALERKLARQGGSMAGASRFWDNVADAAPAMGLLGTVTGLILLFGKVDDASAIGSAMAISLLSSLYGLILSNLIAAPLARRLAHVDAERQKWQSDVIRRLDELARREYADLRDLPSQDTDPASEKTETEPHSGIVSLGHCEELGKGVAFKKQARR